MQAVNPNEVIVEQSKIQDSQVSSNVPLTEGETILWHRDSTHGLIHKEVVLEEVVTNKRCLRYDVPNRRIVAQVGIESMPEVVIMNVHRINDSLGGGIFLTPRMLGLPGLPVGLYGGPRRGNLKVFGDVSLMVKGNMVMTFENVKDPQGLKQLIHALKLSNLGPQRRLWAAGGMGRRFDRFNESDGTTRV